MSCDYQCFYFAVAYSKCLECNLYVIMLDLLKLMFFKNKYFCLSPSVTTANQVDFCPHFKSILEDIEE